MGEEQKLTAEQEMIREVLRWDESQTDRLRGQAPQGIDWPQVEAFCLEQGVLPLFYSRLKKVLDFKTGPEDLERLKTLFRINAERNLRMAGKLIQLIGLLNDQGVMALPFKGPALAIQAYGDLSLRQISDLDLFIPPGQAIEAVRILEKAGFVSDFRLAEKMKNRLIRGGKDLWLIQKDLQIDIHQQMPEGPRSYALREILWEDTGSVLLLDRKIPVLSLENTCLVLCLQGAEDGWNSLSRVCDLIFLIKNNPALNWERLFQKAGESRMTAILGLGLLLGQEVSGASLPVEAGLPLREIKRLKTMAASLYRGWFRGSPASPRLTLLPKVMDHWWDACRYLTYFAFTPRTSDLKWLPLPPCLYPLYYFLHPLRLSFKFSPSFLRSLSGRKKV
ncbi:MAG: nucleotidyltransferase family protein [Thermodesulfobacteriota bacterium]